MAREECINTRVLCHANSHAACQFRNLAHPSLYKHCLASIFQAAALSTSNGAFPIVKTLSSADLCPYNPDKHAKAKKYQQVQWMSTPQCSLVCLVPYSHNMKNRCQWHNLHNGVLAVPRCVQSHGPSLYLLRACFLLCFLSEHLFIRWWLCHGKPVLWQHSNVLLTTLCHHWWRCSR